MVTLCNVLLTLECAWYVARICVLSLSAVPVEATNYSNPFHRNQAKGRDDIAADRLHRRAFQRRRGGDLEARLQRLLRHVFDEEELRPGFVSCTLYIVQLDICLKENAALWLNRFTDIHFYDFSKHKVHVCSRL